MSDVKELKLFGLVGFLCLNLLSTAFLFLGHTPVVSKALKMSFSAKDDTQADQNKGMKSPFLSGRIPKDLWV
jgi:hypothetical protein